MDRNISSIHVILLFESLHYLPFYKTTTKRTFPDFKFILHSLKMINLRPCMKSSTPLNSIVLVADNTARLLLSIFF